MDVRSSQMFLLGLGADNNPFAKSSRDTDTGKREMKGATLECCKQQIKIGNKEKQALNNCKKKRKSLDNPIKL